VEADVDVDDVVGWEASMKLRYSIREIMGTVDKLSSYVYCT
jgi:hypothetical protein